MQLLCARGRCQPDASTATHHQHTHKCPVSVPAACRRAAACWEAPRPPTPRCTTAAPPLTTTAGERGGWRGSELQTIVGGSVRPAVAHDSIIVVQGRSEWLPAPSANPACKQVAAAVGSSCSNAASPLPQGRAGLGRRRPVAMVCQGRDQCRLWCVQGEQLMESS